MENDPIMRVAVIIFRLCRRLKRKERWIELVLRWEGLYCICTSFSAAHSRLAVKCLEVLKLAQGYLVLPWPLTALGF